MKYSNEDMRILKRAYIDYKQLERQLNIDIGITTDLQSVYEYFNGLKDVNFTNVDLDVGGYFDFDYKDMCLTISKWNIRNVCKLAESIEVYDEDGSVVTVIDFNDLEKLVLGYE